MTFPREQLSRRRYLLAALKTLLPGLLILGLVLTALYEVTLQQQVNLIQQQERSATERTRQLMSTQLDNMIADVQIMANLAARMKLDAPRGVQQLTDNLLRFARHKPGYAQLRFINARGREVVRINQSRQKAPVAATRLQNKAHRYYFQQGMALEQGQVYVSPFDLNVDRGKVETNNPTLRVAARVTSPTGQALGIVIVNLDGAELFERVWGDTALKLDTIALVSQYGYSLIRPQASSNRVSFSDKNLLAESTPQLWERINRTSRGELIFNDRFFAFNTLEIRNATGNHRWKIFTVLNSHALQQVRTDFVYANLPGFGLVLMMLIIGSVMHARYQLRHRGAMELNAYERSFRHLFEDIQLAAVALNEDARISFCNDHFLQRTGYSRDQLLQCNWFEMVADDSPTLWHELLEAAEQASGPCRFLQNILSRTGQTLTFAWTCTLQQQNDNDTRRITLVGEDITARLAREKQLIQLTQAVEQSANAVMITNTHGHITYVNPAFCQLSGYSPDEVQGRNPGFLKSGYTSDEQYQTLWRTLRDGGIWQGEFHNRKKNGELFWERAMISPVRNSTGETLSFIAVKQDVTAEKHLQHQLEQETQERIRNEQLAAVGRMANMIAHDLRNPLSSIRVGIQLTRRKPGIDQETQELCQISLEQIRYMDNILEDLLSYSRPADLNPEWLSVNTLTEQVIMSQLRLIKDRNIFIDQDLGDNLPTIHADPAKLRQVIQNLVVNAIQAADDNHGQLARVSLRSRLIFTDQGPKLEVEICNNGKGVDPCLGDKVFEPFFTTRAKGTGLGLAIVQRIVRQHHGHISIQAIPGRKGTGGTRALLSLPVSHHPASQPEHTDTADENNEKKHRNTEVYSA